MRWVALTLVLAASSSAAQPFPGMLMGGGAPTKACMSTAFLTYVSMLSAAGVIQVNGLPTFNPASCAAATQLNKFVTVSQLQ